MQLGPGAPATLVQFDFIIQWVLTSFGSPPPCFLGLEVCPGTARVLWRSGEGRTLGPRIFLLRSFLLCTLPQSIQSPQGPVSRRSGCLFPAARPQKVDSGSFLVGAGETGGAAPGRGERSGWGSASGEELQHW